MSFKDGRIGIGKDPIFPLDISGSCRIDGDLILGGRFSDAQGNAIQLGSGSGATSTPDQNQNGIPSWSSSSITTVFGGNVGIGTTSPGSTLEIKDVTSGTAGEVESILKVNNVSGYHMVSLGTAGPTNYHSGSISIYKTTNATGTIKSVHLSGSTDDTYFNGGGNVGIGTTSPSTLLVVGEDGGGHATNVPGIHMKSIVGQPAKCYVVGQDTTHNVHLGYWANSTVGNGYGVLSCYGGSNNLCLQHSGGNVGIGTTNPEFHLDIRGSGEQIINVYSDGTAGTSGAYARFSYNNNADAGLLYVGALSDSVMVNSRYNYPMIFYIDNVEKMKIKTNGHIDINKGHVDGWVDSHEGNNRINLNDQNFGVGAGKFALDMGSSSNSECTAIWCYEGGGRGIRFCSTLNGDNDKFSDMTTRMIITGDNGNVGIGPLMTSPSYRLDVNGDFRVYPWATTISGNIDMEDGSTYDANTFYVWKFPTGPMGAGNCITVKIGRGVHTSGGWYGGSCLVVTFVPSHYGYLGYSQYFVHHYSTRDDTTIGRVQCHGQWSYGAIALRGDRKYHYVIHEGGHPYLSGDSTFTSAETITVGSVVSQSWSDDRIKHNETKITNGLDVINKLNPLRYIKTMHRMYEKDHIFELGDDGTPIDTSGNKLGVNAWIIENGIIAQEVEKIDELKHAVGKSTAQDASGNIIKTVKYNDVFVYNIAATQELDRKVIALENEKNDKSYLESKIETLTKENQDKNVKIETLTKENYDQNVKILDLYKENESLKARLAKIETFLGL